MAGRPIQLCLPVPRTWGGRRAGAGRKPTPGRRPGVPHRARSAHVAAHPASLRSGRGDPPLPPLRPDVPGRAPCPSPRLLAPSSGSSFGPSRSHPSYRGSRSMGARSGGVRARHPPRPRCGPRLAQGCVDDRIPRAHPHHAGARAPSPLVSSDEFSQASPGGDRDRSCSSAPWFAGWRAPRAATGIGPRRSRWRAHLASASSAGGDTG
jgi:hypothetical protein